MALDPISRVRTWRRIQVALVSMAQAAVRIYQCTLSHALGPCCRFTPSCSEYAHQALGCHGLMRGLGLTLWRLLRCHPFSRGGLDPVAPPRAPRARHPQLRPGGPPT